jgi:alpha/beta superfamily hydrolase
MNPEPVSFKSTDGLELQGEVQAPSEPIGAIVLCHAHPRMQGTMKSPLLIAIADDCVARGFGVVRFNFRGVGNSQGVGSDGIDEVGDVAGALAFARATFSDLPVGLVGWSFGGAVAARAAAQDGNVTAGALVAPSTVERPGISAGLPQARELGLKGPMLVVCGSNDKVVLPADCRAWVEGAPGVSYHEINAANHFFWAKYDALTELVGSFLQVNISPSKEES